MNTLHKRNNYYYWLFFATSLLPIAAFAIIYSLIQVPLFAYLSSGSFVFLSILGLIANKIEKHKIFYRMSMATIFGLFFIQALYSGGIFSPAMPHFIIGILITFFYFFSYCS